MFATTFYLFIMPNKYAKDANVHMIVTTLGKKKILLFSQYVMYIQRLYECTYIHKTVKFRASVLQHRGNCFLFNCANLELYSAYDIMKISM
jgi:hypothetical protein